MKKNSIKKNYLFNVSYQIFALFVPLITTPYISRVFGASGTGTYSYTYAMVRYFWLASVLGTSTYGTRNIGIYQDEPHQRSCCFWNIISLKLVLSFIFGTLYMIYVVFLSNNKFISFLQGINLLAVFFDITWLFQGMERFDKVAIKNFIIKIINVIYIFLVVKTSSDLWKYTLGVAAFLFLGNVSLWIEAKKYIKKVQIKELHPFKDFKVIFILFIPSVAVQVFSIIDKSMIGWFSTNSLENGYYEQAIKIVDMSLVLITTLGSVMIPKISREYKRGNKEEIVKCLNKSYIFTFALSLPMIFGLLSISNCFVPIFFGIEYKKTVGILNILTLLFLFMGLNSVSGSQYLVSTNQQNIHTKYLLIGGIVNVVLNCLLIPKLYSIGAAIGSVAGELIISILELRYLYKTNQFNIFNIIYKVWKYFVCGIIMFILMRFISLYVTSLVGVLLSILFGSMLYIILLIMFKDEFVLDEINIFIKKYKGGKK